MAENKLTYPEENGHPQPESKEKEILLGEDGEKKELLEGKPKRNIVIILIAIAFIFATVFNFYNKHVKDSNAKDTSEEKIEQKISESNNKNISITDMERQVENIDAAKPKTEEEIRSEALKDFKKAVEEEEKSKAERLKSVNDTGSGTGKSKDTSFNENDSEVDVVDEKTRHIEAVSNSPIFEPSGNKAGSSINQPNADDEIQKLYTEQMSRMSEANSLAGANEESNQVENASIAVQRNSDRDVAWLEKTTNQNFRNEKVRFEKSSEVNKTIFEGTAIPVTVTQVTSSDFPGKFKVKTTRPIYSKSGKVLLKPGSTVLGMANTDVRPGQTSVQTAFYRIINTKGNTVYLSGMQGADESGINGVNGDVNNHFFKIFASSFAVAMIQSIITKNENSITVNNPTGDVSVSSGAVNTLGEIAKENLNRNRTIMPTITLKPGQEFNIIVTKDIVVDDDV